ncbi:MAG: enolase C-terminal domain-like protein [Thermomicrobiales bacterium]
MFELQACDVLQIDVTHFGGLGEAKKVAGWAEAYYMMMAPHNVGGPIGTMANLHLVSTLTNFKIQEHFNDFADSWVKDIEQGMPEIDPVDGCFPVPTKPGLGITSTEAAALEHPMEAVDFNLFKTGWERRDVRCKYDRSKPCVSRNERSTQCRALVVGNGESEGEGEGAFDYRMD